ncbi:MFS transporter [Plantactinospora sp. GCM10030261]|uniref:MFS transporter n=1 Tax=Plantactinospora sp. GCM10030261 TaxID=3273420 RepID=UPI0036161532
MTASLGAAPLGTALLGGDFRRLLAGQSLSWLGNGFQVVALAVAVLTAGGGPGDLGLVLATAMVATLGCTLFGGVWADRLQPQRIMVLSDAVRCVATAGMAVMFGADRYSLPLLCGLAAVSAGAGAFFGPAFAALKPMLVPVAHRQSANATLNLSQTGCLVVGPAVGGVVVAAYGAPVGFAVNSASFLAAMVAIMLIRTRVGRAPRAGMRREMGEGWREIRTRDWLFVGVLSAAAFHVANGVVLVLVQVVAIERLGGARAVGFIAAAEGFGGVLGALAAMRWRPVRLLRAGWWALLLMPVWVIAYVWPGVLTAVLFGAVVAYAGLSFFSVAWDTALQDHIPHRVLARVSSWDQLTSFAAMPVGNALAGPLAAAFGIDPVLVACAAVFLVAVTVPLFVPGSRRLTRASDDGLHAGRTEPVAA